MVRNLEPKHADNPGGDCGPIEFEMVYQQRESVEDNRMRIQFPIPMKVVDGVQEYDDSDRPWIWDLKYAEPDLYGSTWSPQ